MGDRTRSTRKHPPAHAPAPTQISLNNTMSSFEELAFYALAAIGAVKVAWILISYLKNLLTGGVNLSKVGKWAIVTGASEGIGAAYCEVFAKKGLNIVLISRSMDKLQKTEEELKTKCPKVETKCIALDLGTLGTDAAAKQTLSKTIESLEVGVLVNNVGISYEYPEFFDELSDDRVQKLIDLNVVATTWMTKAVLPGMLERKRGVILSISSAAGVVTAGSPMLAMYSGTKAFVERFSTSLAGEYAGKGLTIQTHTPYFVSSNMSKMRPSLTCPKPIKYAQASVAALGKGGPNVVPYFWHWIQHSVMESAPVWMASKLQLNMHLDIKKRALRKKQRLAEEASKKSQ